MTFNQRVVGSIPTALTKQNQSLTAITESFRSWCWCPWGNNPGNTGAISRCPRIAPKTEASETPGRRGSAPIMASACPRVASSTGARRFARRLPTDRVASKMEPGNGPKPVASSFQESPPRERSGRSALRPAISRRVRRRRASPAACLRRASKPLEGRDRWRRIEIE